METSSTPDLLRAVIDESARIFAQPPRLCAARTYLRQRGIDPANLDSSWLLGYAPPGWTRLVDKLQDRFSDLALIDADLAHPSSAGSLIDTFRDRVIFGVRDADGCVAGFIGRDLSGNDNAPKYLNTRQTALFDKSSLLFGLSEGLAGDPRPRQPVIVEGSLDVLAIAARANADRADLLPVAACGTAFTARHARLVATAAFAHESPVVVAMDGDAAGRTAALAAGEQLRAAGLNVGIAALPNGTDPAEYLSHPGTSLDPFTVDYGVPLLTVRVQQAIAAQGDRMQWIEGRLAAARAIADYLATYPASYTAHQIGWLADTLDLSRSTITREFTSAYDRKAIQSLPRRRARELTR
jgi:DNA primase